MTFQEWLRKNNYTVEAMTSTSSIANVLSPLPFVCRNWPPTIASDLEPAKKEKKKKIKPQPQVKD